MDKTRYSTSNGRTSSLNNCLPRHNLFKLLDTAKKVPLIVVHADAGYGKTTLVSSYLAERKRVAIWYYSAMADSLRDGFLMQIFTAIRQTLPGICSEYGSFEPHEDTESMVLELAGYMNKASLSLVVEEYERLKPNSEVDRVVLSLIKHLSPECQVFILSRSRPNLPLTRLVMNGYAKIITKEELAFTGDETRELFCQVFRSYISKHELEMIINRLEGWATGLRLAYEALKGTTAGERKSFWARFMQSPVLFDYLVEEVLSALPVGTVDFLYQTSLFSVLEPELIKEYLGIGNASLVLHKLTRENLFTYSLDSTGTKYRYHFLFRQYLYECLLSKVGTAGLREKHALAAELYCRHGMLDQAIVHSLLARQEYRIPRLINKLAENNDTDTIFHLMMGWVESAFPSIGDTGWVILRRMMPISFYESVLANLCKVADGKQRNVDLLSRGYAQKYLGTYYFYIGDAEKSNHWVKKARDSFRTLGQLDSVSIMCSLLALVCILKGKPDAAEEHIEIAAECVDNEESYTYKNLLITKIELVIADNNFEEAENLALKALDLENSYLIRNSICYSALALASAYQGKHEEALTNSEIAIEEAKKTESPLDLGYAYIRQAIVLREVGRIQEASAVANKAVAALDGFNFLLARALLVRADLACATGAPEAEQLWAETKKFWEKNKYQFSKYDWVSAPVLLGKKTGYNIKAEGFTPVPTAHEDRNKRQTDKENRANPLVIQTLGTLKLFIYGQQSNPSTWGRDPSRRLFLYLLINRGKMLNRDMIIEALWPDGDPVACANRFTVALHVLRSKLGMFPQLVERHGEMFCLRLPEGAYLDIELYCGLAEEGLKAGDQSMLMEAVNLYRGDFLEEYAYDDFLEGERERVRVMQCRVLMALANIFDKKGDFDKALEWYRKVQLFDPYMEEPVSKIMEILLYKGEPGTAIGHYKRFYEFMQKEIGIAPSEKMRTLYKEILGNVK